MTLSYLILAHKNPSQFHRMVKKLDAENVYFFVHIDKTVDNAPFKQAFIHSKNIFFVEDAERMVTPWSSIGICKVTLLLLNEVIKKFTSNTYCILLSGQDYPLNNNEYIYNFYQSNYGNNYIVVEDIKDIWPEWANRFERYNFHLPNKRLNRGIFPIFDSRFLTLRNFKHIFYVLKNFGLKTTLNTLGKPKRIHPDYLAPKGGDTWWALPIETVTEIINYLKEHPDLLDYHTYTHVPDETLFASIVNNLKEQEQIKTTNTYTNWLRNDVELPVTFKENDFEELKQASKNYLFARKFDVAQDSAILNKLDQYINHQKTDISS